MRHLFKFNSATFIAIVASVVLYLITVLLDFDLFEMLVVALDTVDHLEIDEFILPLLVVCLGVAIDLYLAYRRKQTALLIAASKLESLQATMRTVQDIVGNSLNRLVMFRLEAEQSGALSEDSLKELEFMIDMTSYKINKLSGLSEILEKEVGKGIFFVDIDDQKQ